MQSQFFKWVRFDLEKKEKSEFMVQGALRRSVLGAYEYVFPEEALPEVLSMLGLTEDSHGVKKSFFSSSRLAVLRKIFGAKKIPQSAHEAAKKLAPSILLNNRYRALGDCMIGGVSIHPIGIKEDERKGVKEWGFHQEML